MAERDVYTKLQQNVLLRDTPFTTEMEVVYLLVELRKFMDHNQLGSIDDYKLLRFYCDWAVHTEKSRSLGHIQEVLERLYASCKETIESNFTKNHLYELDNFLRLTDLRGNMRKFFSAYDLDAYMLEDGNCWFSFIKLLLAVLQDQPIIGSENADIKEIMISSVGPKWVQLDVSFSSPIKNKEGEYLPGIGIVAGYE